MDIAPNSSNGPRNSRLRRHVGTAILASVISTATGAVRAQEVEPNDTLQTAYATGMTGPGMVWIPNLQLGNGDWLEADVDIYSLEVNSAATLPLSLDVRLLSAGGSSLDGYLRLFDATGTELAANDDAFLVDTDPQLRTFLVEHGTYYIGASASGNPHYDPTEAGSGRVSSTGAYTLTITAAQGVFPQDSLELNDQTGRAIDLYEPYCDWWEHSSCVISGQFIGDSEHGRRDVDIYRVWTDGPARIDVKVESTVYGSVLDPVVRMRTCGTPASAPSLGDPCGIGENDGGASSGSDASLSVGVTDEVYEVYIMVSGSGNRRYDPATSGSGEPGSVGYYNLSVEITQYDGDGPHEPNDSIITATKDERGNSITPYDTTAIHGYVGDGPYALTRGDRDFYQIQVDVSGDLVIDVVPVEGSELDPILAVYDAQGKRLAVGETQNTGIGQRLTVPSTCREEDYESEPPRGMLYVMVMGTRQRFPNDPFVPWPGPYSYSHITRYEEYRVAETSGSTGAYQLTLHLRRRPCALEPNDTLATATNTGIVDEGHYVCTTGVLGFESCGFAGLDVDMWSVEVVRTPATLEVLAPLCQSYFWYAFDAMLLVFNADGEQVYPGVYDPEPEDLRAVSVLLDMPGTYYVAISADDNPDYDPMAACSGSSTNEYPSLPYDMLIKLRQLFARPPCAGESNDTMATAIDTGLVDEGHYVCRYGSLFDSRCCGYDYPFHNVGPDVDMWSVQVERGPTLLRIEAPALEWSNPDGMIRVFDQGGNKIAEGVYDSEPRSVLEMDVLLESLGTYYVAMSAEYNTDYDPSVRCSGSNQCWQSCRFSYEMHLTLTTQIPQPSLGPGGACTDGASRPAAETAAHASSLAHRESGVTAHNSIAHNRGAAPLFATRLDPLFPLIDQLDPLTGQVTRGFPVPERCSAGSRGMAYDGDRLYYIGVGVHPMLYHLDPLTGNVLDKYVLWAGSGFYNGAVVLGGWLHVLDIHDRSIHVIDPLDARLVRTLHLQGPKTGVATGGLTALTGPARLYVADSYNNSLIYEIDPASGLVADQIGPLATRPTTLASDVGLEGLYVADWASDEIEVVDTSGAQLRTFGLTYPVGSLAAPTFYGDFPDCNSDGVSDLENMSSGTSEDCNMNSVIDECDVADGTSQDCNGNDVPDECETDCNGNGVADDCETWGEQFTALSPQLSPIGTGSPQQYTIESPRDALGDVTLSFLAFGDFDAAAEFIGVDINGTPLGNVFQEDGSLCPTTPDTDHLVVGSDVFNAAVGGSDAVINMAASSAVALASCPTDSFVQVEVTYRRPSLIGDCNTNGVPDECDDDCNGNGVPDECDIADGTSDDAEGDSVPDECQTVLYVDDNAPDGGSGLSWPESLGDLQMALAAARNRSSGITEVRVAQGVYMPGAPGDNQATFQLISGVAVIGGYAGYGAPDPDERDHAKYRTVFSGDLDGDDDLDPGGMYIGNNCYHVVTASGVDSTAILDGVTITGGHAGDTAWRNSCGAGLYNDAGSPTIRNCTITKNYVSNWPSTYSLNQGAGMYNVGGRPTLVNCAFTKNGPGGGYFRPFDGGGVFNSDSVVTLIGCTFEGNMAIGGSGMASEFSEVSARDCAFFGNGNGYGRMGGAMWNRDSDVVLHNCAFAGNYAGTGAAILVSGGRTDITNCTFTANSAGSGPAVACNSTPYEPYGTTLSSRVRITNSILWDGGEEMHNVDGSTVTVSFSAIQDDIPGDGSVFSGTGNIDVDPLFVAGPDGCLYLSQMAAGQPLDSPCAGTGGDTALNLGLHTMTTRSDEEPDTGIVDMGYHYPITSLPLRMGDFDRNGHIDLADFAELQCCFTGSTGEAYVTVLPCCRVFDFEYDGDVDLDDYDAFRGVFGP